MTQEVLELFNAGLYPQSKSLKDCQVFVNMYGNKNMTPEIVSAIRKSLRSHSWQTIDTAPMDGTQLLLAAYIIPSAEAARNGSKPFWDIGLGRPIYPTREGTHWTGILGGVPSHWKSIEPPVNPS